MPQLAIGSRCKTAALSVLGAWMVAGCGDPAERNPTLTGFEPAVVSSERSTDAVVRGTDLYPRLHSDLDTDDPATQDAAWRVYVGDAELDDVAWRDSTALDVTIPAGLDDGVYAVRADGPAGERLVLADAVTVASGPVGLTISIEDAPGGDGAPIGDVQLAMGEVLAVYAVVRPPGEPAADLEVSWSVVGAIGTIDDQPSAAAAFTATTVGTGAIAASHPVASAGQTGTIEVLAPGTCGDTLCDVGESACTCGADCPAVCGDGCCSAGESAASCDADCSGACDVCDGGACTETCGASACAFDCAVPGCDCTLDCPRNSHCASYCTSGATCTTDCSDVNTCELTCAAATACDLRCEDANACRATCDGAGTACDIDCSDVNNCSQVSCTSGAECLVQCAEANNCAIAQCTGGSGIQSCPGYRIACNRPCP